MALSRIKKGDTVKVIAGKNKGKVATVSTILVSKRSVVLNGIGERKRHHAANRVAPAGKRDIQVPVQISNVALVVDNKSNNTSRVSTIRKPSGEKVRGAKAYKNKEVK